MTRAQLQAQMRKLDAAKEALTKQLKTVRSPAKKTRARNPVKAANTKAKIAQAVQLYRRFRLAEPEYIDSATYAAPDVCMVIGKCSAVCYDTIRDGKKEQYMHEFGKRSQPILASSWDGKHLYIVGGNYDFTQDGIIDK